MSKCNNSIKRLSSRTYSIISVTTRLVQSASGRPTFHKRPLPESLISLSSLSGKQLFREALAEGGMESYFLLSEQFITQSETSYCALTSLAMVLNALNFDPKKVWKGAWRWVSEETLQCETQICGHSLEKVRELGMNFHEFESLARCHGIRINAVKAEDHQHDCTLGINQFRTLVQSISSSEMAESFIIANFSRKALDQTGDGHFSPIGGYHKNKDLVLILDVARFKYPPFWVPLERLWHSMAVEDKTTNSSRGYFTVSTWNKSDQINRNADNIDVNNNQNTIVNQQPQNNHIIDKYQDEIKSHHNVTNVIGEEYNKINVPLKNHNTSCDLINTCPPLLRSWENLSLPKSKIECMKCHTKHKIHGAYDILPSS